MRSKRSRFLPVPRFTKTNLQQVLATKSQRRAVLGKHEYQSLEPRQMLNADIGLNFTSVNDGSGVNSNAAIPNISAAVGENHIVQFVDDGYAIFDKTNGSVLEQGSLEAFFNATSGPDPGPDVGLSQPRLIYDTSFDRWYAIAVDDQDLNDDFGGLQGNRIWLAGSNTPDPTGTWKGTFIQLDNGSATSEPGLFSSGTSRISLSVDEFALSITAQEAGIFFIDDDGFPQSGVSGTAVLTLPQVALFGGAIEIGRLEGGRGVTGLGAETQFSFDSTLEPQSFPQGAADSAYSLAIDGLGDPDTFPVGRQGDQLILTEYSRPGIPLSLIHI